MDLAFLNVREKLDQAQYFLPEHTGRPQLIFNTTADEPIAVLAIRSNTESNELFDTRLTLKRWAEQVLSRRLEQAEGIAQAVLVGAVEDRKSTRLNSSHVAISYAVLCLKKKTFTVTTTPPRR